MLGRVVFGVFVLLFASLSRAACQEEGMYCSIGRQTRVIRGIQVTKDCWQYKYRLNCKHVSKNDCVNISPDDCVLASERCKEKAKEGDLEFCANYERDFSCKKIVKYQKEREELMKGDQPAVSKEILCKGFCLDGACGAVREAADEFDKDIGDAVALLNAVREIKDSKAGTDLINLFSVVPETCKDKALEYTNCCTELGGWGELLGASCGPDAENLAKKRAEKQCVLVGKLRAT